jgi:uncharacterized protein YukJ
MKLNAYGLLIGKITASRPKRPESPHWLLFVQPDDPNHPAYRVAINLQTTERKHRPELQYQIVEFGRRATPAGTALIRKLTTLGISKSFIPALSDPALPRLDFVRGGFVNPKRFVELRPGVKTLETEFRKAVAEAQQAKAPVAVFGSGYPVDPQTGKSVPTGFTGVENIHMNQGHQKPHQHQGALSGERPQPGWRHHFPAAGRRAGLFRQIQFANHEHLRRRQSRRDGYPGDRQGLGRGAQGDHAANISAQHGGAAHP